MVGDEICGAVVSIRPNVSHILSGLVTCELTQKLSNTTYNYWLYRRIFCHCGIGQHQTMR